MALPRKERGGWDGIVVDGFRVMGMSTLRWTDGRVMIVPTQYPPVSVLIGGVASLQECNYISGIWIDFSLGAGSEGVGVVWPSIPAASLSLSFRQVQG